jgi:hypothetical protein
LTGYEPSKWREFLKKHDDIDTYCPIKCETCHNERPYCFCAYPKFEKVRSEVK